MSSTETWRLLAFITICARVRGGKSEAEAPELLREMQEFAKDKGDDPALLPSLDDLRAIYRDAAQSSALNAVSRRTPL